MNKTVIGIDPGANGAISFTTTNDKIRKSNGVSPWKCHKLLAGRTLICSMAMCQHLIVFLSIAKN